MGFRVHEQEEGLRPSGFLAKFNSPPGLLKQAMVAIVGLWSASASYGLSQVWCYLIVSATGGSVWITLASNGDVTGVKHLTEQTTSWIVLVVMHVLLVTCIFPAVVNIQLKIHQKQWKELGKPPPTGWVIATVKGIDGISIGAAFYIASTSFFLILSITNEWGLPEDNLSSIVVSNCVVFSFCVVFLLGIEVMIAPLHKLFGAVKDGELSPWSMAKVSLTHDWYVGSFGWLLGYGTWLFAWETLAPQYIAPSGGIKAVWALWCLILFLIAFVTIAIFILFNTGQHAGLIHFIYGPSRAGNAKRERVTIKSESCLYRLRKRSADMMLIGTRSFPAIGMYYTFRYQVRDFDNALSMPPKENNSWLFWAPVWIVTSVLFAVSDHLKSRWHARCKGKVPDDQLSFESVEQMLLFAERVISYISFKAWQAIFLGTYWQDYCYCVEYQLPLLICVTAVCGLLGWLHGKVTQWSTGSQNQKDHDYTHGELCACVQCRPEAYPEDEFPRDEYPDYVNGHRHEDCELCRKGHHHEHEHHHEHGHHHERGDGHHHENEHQPEQKNHHEHDDSFISTEMHEEPVSHDGVLRM